MPTHFNKKTELFNLSEISPAAIRTDLSTTVIVPPMGFHVVGVKAIIPASHQSQIVEAASMQLVPFRDVRPIRSTQERTEVTRA